MISHALRIALTISLLLFTAMQSGAATLIWDGGGVSTNFGHGLNWDTNTPPGSVDTANFRNGNNGIVTFTANQNVVFMNIFADIHNSTSIVEFDFNGNTLDIAGHLRIADPGTLIGGTPINRHGRLTLGDGNLTVNGDLFVGEKENISIANGELILGAGSELNVQGTLEVETTGTSTVVINSADSILNVTKLSIPGSVPSAFTLNSGTVQIDGGWFDNGVSDYTLTATGGDATFKLINGATANLANLSLDSATVSETAILDVFSGSSISSIESRIGDLVGSNGTVTVDGAGSTWTMTDALIVGDQGTGTLNITGGGSVSALHVVLADNTGASGTALVDGSGSSLISGGVLNVGDNDNGILTISGGGQVSNVSNGRIAVFAGSTGEVTVTGTGSAWTNSSSLSVGIGGTATLNIQDSGTVSVATTLVVGATGTVNLNGGILKVDSNAVVVDGTLNYVTGTFHLTDAGGYTVGANSGPIDQVLGYQFRQRVYHRGQLLCN